MREPDSMDRYKVHEDIEEWLSLIRDGDWTDEFPLLNIAVGELCALLEYVHLDS